MDIPYNENKTITIENYNDLVIGIIETMAYSMVDHYKNGERLESLEVDYDDGILKANVCIKVKVETYK